MLAVERLRFIERQLRNKKVVLVNELSKEMQVTEETIRKDLEKMEKQNLICRVHGGAYLKEGYHTEAPVEVRTRIYRKEKELMAELCMNYVDTRDSLVLDCSTTSVCIAQALARENKKLTVITNSLLVAWELAKGDQIRLILLGGTLNRNTDSFYGNITLEEMGHYHVDKAFISSAGISAEAGITDYSQEEADLRRVMMKQAKENFYVADSTKLGRSTVYVTTGLEEVGTLISDCPVSQVNLALYRELKKLGIAMAACRREEERIE